MGIRRRLQDAINAYRKGYQVQITQTGSSPVWHTGSDFIQDGYTYNAVIYSVISLITSAARKIPFKVYRIKNQKDLTRLKNINNIEIKSYLKTKALEEVDTPLTRLLEHPNPNMRQSDLIEAAVGYRLLTGNSYFWGIRPGAGRNAGKVTEINILPSQAVKIESDGQDITGYIFGQKEIPKEDVLHLKYWNPDYSTTGSHLYGLSPLEAAVQTIKLSNNNYVKANANLTDTTPPGILYSKDSRINEAQAKQLEDAIRRTARNGSAPAVTSANMGWLDMSVQAQADIASVNKFTIRDICNIFNVNSALLNDPDNKVYANAKEAGRALYTNSVIPELTTIRDGLNEWLTSGGLYIDFDLSNVHELMADQSVLSAMLEKAWWLTPNEKRGVMGYPDSDVPEMDEYLVPRALMPVGELSALPINPKL